MDDADTKVAQISNENGKLIGMQCDEVVQDNELNEVGMIFYLDVASPAGNQADAINHISEALVLQIADSYGISSGVRCDEPPLDGTSWVVQIQAKPDDFKKVDLFDKCKEYQFDETSQDCLVYETLVTAAALGVTDEIPDLMEYIRLNLGSLCNNTPFGCKFLGVPITDPTVGDAGRDNLSPPTNLNKQVPIVQDNGRTITILGGFLVALFAIAFAGIALVLWRRRRAYVRQNREMHLSLSKSSDLQQYDTEPHVTISEEEVDSAKPPELSSPTPTEENFPHNITFDLGTSFKDQLMGVHAGGMGGPRRHPHMAGPFGSAPSADGTDSDADSWAQTDGTIGSLELQLEPITAEV